MFPQAFPVVGRDDDDGLVQDPLFPEAFQDLPDEGIHVSDLAVVQPPRPPGILALVGLGRLVRGVGVVEMDPAEEPTVPVRFEPIEKGFGDLAPFTLDGIEADLLVLGEIEIVIVMTKTLAEAPAGIENEGADERARRSAFLLQDLGQSDIFGLQVEAAVVPDAVNVRIGPREDRGM